MSGIIKMDTRASSGNMTTTNKYIVYWIECVQNSQNIANNTSNVTVKVRIKRTNTGYTTYGSGTIYCKINGTTYSASISSSQKITSTAITLFTKTLTISHNSDGTKSLTMSAWISHSKFSSNEQSYTQTLTTIPRTSSFTLSASSLDAGKTLNININRASSSFVHHVFYSFGNYKETISLNATTSASYTIPLEHLNAIPNATSGTGTISVDTYVNNNYIGSTSKNFTVNVPSNVIPTLTSLTSQVVANGADVSYGYVKGKSKAKLTINGATGKYGSTIKSYSISGGGFSSSSSSFTTGGLTSAGNITFTATVTDSRGRKSSAKTVTISVLDYNNPTIDNFSVIRCNSNGTANEDGTYLKVYAKYSYTNLNNKNKLSSNIKYKKSSSSSWTNAGSIQSGSSLIIGNNTITTNSAYNIALTISDSLVEIEKVVDVPTAFVTLDFRKGGKGIAIGKMSERDNLFEVAMNTNIIGKLTVNGKTINSGTVNSGGEEVDWNNVPSMNVKGNIGMTGYIKLPNSGGSWLNGATNGNIRGYRQSTASYHPIISQATSSNHKISLGGLGDEFGFHMYDANRTDNGIDKYFRFRLTDKTIQTDARININGDWLYVSGNNGVFFPTHGGGWHMADSTWLRAYNDKSIYSDGTIRVTTAEHRWLKGNSNGSNQNLDIAVYDGNSIYLNPSATSGCAVYLNRNWSGSSGSEPSFYNSKGKGWGYIGNSNNTWYRVYGAGGSVSDRTGKYEILKADIETQYENVKTLNIYNYRTISSRDVSIEEIAETFFNTNFIDSDNNYITKSVEIDGKKYQEIDDTLPKEKIKEIRTKEIIDNNPYFEGCMREDLSLGCMVDEMPLETTFYDNEGGDGKAVDMYSYTTMILGATKHLITKVETLERENEELKNRLDKMEELLNGIINKE